MNKPKEKSNFQKSTVNYITKADAQSVCHTLENPKKKRIYRKWKQVRAATR